MDKPSSVLCLSRRSEQVIETALIECIKPIINDNASWNEEEKSRFLTRFREIYENAVHDNISIDGQTWPEDDDGEETTVLEPVNTARRDYMNKQLVPELDEALVTVAKQRKHCPYMCAQALARHCKHQCSIQRKVEAQPVFEALVERPVEGQEENKHLALRDACLSSVHLVKIVPSMVEKAAEVQSASDMLYTQCVSHTDDIIFAPVRRRLQYREETPTQKTRSSPRLAIHRQSKLPLKRPMTKGILQSKKR